MSTQELVDMVNSDDAAESNAHAADSDDELDGIEEVVKAPSLKDARQHFKALAAFMAENPEFTAQDEVYFHKLSNKAAKMVVSRLRRLRCACISTSSRISHPISPASLRHYCSCSLICFADSCAGLPLHVCS